MKDSKRHFNFEIKSLFSKVVSFIIIPPPQSTSGTPCTCIIQRICLYPLLSKISAGRKEEENWFCLQLI